MPREVAFAGRDVRQQLKISRMDQPREGLSVIRVCRFPHSQIRRSLVVWGFAALSVVSLLVDSRAEAQIDLKELIGGAPRRSAVEQPVIDSVLVAVEDRPDLFELRIHVQLPAGYTIYDARPKADFRTEITTTETGLEPVGEGFTSEKPAKIEHDPVLKLDIAKHYDQVTWVRRYKIISGTPSDAVRLKVQLKGQFCSTGPGGECVLINPPYEATIKPTVSTDKSVDVASKGLPKQIEIRPIRRNKKKGDSPDKIAFNIQLSPEQAGPGEKVVLSITATPDEGWHTYSLTQPDGVGGTPTVLKIDQISGLIPKGAFTLSEAPEFKVAEGIGAQLEVYRRTVTFSREFEVQGDRAPGEFGVSGSIDYQVCDATTCQKGILTKFELGELAGGNAFKEPDTKLPQAVANGKATPTAPLERGVKKQLGDQGLIPFLITAVLAGFVSLMTPCVFPMIPITVSFFLTHSNQAGHSKQAGTLKLAIVYCLSIILTFTALGIIITALFGATALNQLANNSWLNVAIGGVFIAFALSLLGMFEIQVPSWLLTFTAGKGSSGGYVGAIFMAITFTLTSFTCTFAFAGALLAAAAQGEYYWPTLGMLAFSTAFALPFFLLACFPSLLTKLPKSGGWMNTVKVVMGLVELGFAMKFLSVADQGWNPVPAIFDFTFVMSLWAMLSLVAGLYLLGLFRLGHDMPVERLSVPRFLSAVGFLWLALFFVVGLFAPEKAGGMLMPQILAFAPPRLETTGSEMGPTMDHDGLQFALDLKQAIPVAQKQNKPLLLDFTGVNCVNCRRMELKMKEPHNYARLKKFLPVQLYVDKVPAITDLEYADRILRSNLQLQSGWFGDSTLPAYAVVTSDGQTILATFFGLEQNHGDFAKFLDEGFEAWNKPMANTAAPADQAQAKR